MGKRGRSQHKGNRFAKRILRDQHVDVNLADSEDEIDAFHKQRDIVPLDINGDVEESDEDDEEPVFGLKGFDGDDEEDDDDDDDDDEVAKIARQRKFLRAKSGGVEDEMHDDDDDDEDKEEGKSWGRNLYNADNPNYEMQSSDDESPAEEEEEVLRLQRERAKYLSKEDFELEDESDSDRDLTLEEVSFKGKSTEKSPASKKAVDGLGTTYEEVKKDLNALSREEQMDVVYSSAPELVGLLSELNDAIEQLENQVNPLLSKVKDGEIKLEGGVRYLEVKQLLLLAYCQSITFYLLLKSEGQPVRDHPVIARLVEIKGLLDKMKQLDENLPTEFEEFLKKSHLSETVGNPIKVNAALASESDAEDNDPSLTSADIQQAAKPRDRKELVKLDPLVDNEKKEWKHEHQNDAVGLQSMKMLKVRAALEQNLKQNGVFSSISKKPSKGQTYLKSLNGRQFEAYDDFGDDVINVDGGIHESSNGHARSLRPVKLSQLFATKLNKPKVVSGDDDLPKRDDIGERRRKHELRVLAGAGIVSEDDAGDDGGTLEVDGDANMEDSDAGEPEDDFYKQVKKLRAAKYAAKAEIYTRTSTAPSLPEMVDGKRQINSQIEKNRGLTRARKKLNKNPRKKYREKHDKKQKARKGQVRGVRKPTGPYGGEASGINARISRSIRLR
ncbi:Sas10_Utp3 domain-containing protein/Sas10_Utp3_C domain-containing protein [Cephalotus follicularis]|uniref:Sas10_Utp3 domain-containing protein/Sas10_Utp3_C domain-containing protein n=1 Tax=Cephalotus follicularis TaxID=3775 RepID=A0A1Q3BF95_CEPFO|nr:Sas10_Utp3 domain-containing protein/Sas10_Utp3_C domain-containing protein [Cephalotus follicularis]